MNPHIETPLTEAIMAARAARASGEQPAATPRASVPIAVRPSAAALGLPASDLVLGRYRLQGELGHGAAGTVLKAYDENLGRTVAIKVMAPALRDNAVAMALFVREAKALAKLNHTNIVAIYDQARDDDKIYLIMEYVDGSTLLELAKHARPMPPLRALEYVEQLCAGLIYAHGKRLVHRDIKPANIFLARDGTVKLGDFGLARVVDQLSHAQTAVRGTPLYMAPEQVLGEQIDHRADLYAVGGTLYDLIAGRPPFIDGRAMYHQVHTAPEPPSHWVPAIAADLDALVLACLAKAPDARISSAKELQRRVRRLIKRYRRALRTDRPDADTKPDSDSSSWP